MGLIPGSGRSLGEGKDYPFQYSGLENSMEYIVHGVAKSQTRLSNFFIIFFYSYLVCSAVKLVKAWVWDELGDWD